VLCGGSGITLSRGLADYSRYSKAPYTGATCAATHTADVRTFFDGLQLLPCETVKRERGSKLHPSQLFLSEDRNLPI
jgi:hypothetical protein